jgi:long-chain fatty acid transport protein
MQWSRIGFARFVGLSLIAVAIVSPAQAAGFSIFEQGSNAMGQAMAVTAQADDPSAMFYNVGGLAFLDERDFYAGLTLIALGDSTFEGADPTPGAGEPGAQSDQLVFPPHFYWVEPLYDRWNLGLSVTAPFGLNTEWEDPVDVVFDPITGRPTLIRWSGRYISDKAVIKDTDLTPSIGYQVTDKIGVGFGVVVRFSSVELRRRIDGNDVNPTIIDEPGTDVGQSRVESDTDTGFGFNLCILHRFNDFLTWGFSYRSSIKVDYSGDVRLSQILTGNSAWDAAAAAVLPFDQNLPFETSVEFPDQASIGVGLQLNPNWHFEADFNWTGWSSFDQLTIELKSPNEGLSETRPQNWDDAINIRTGVRWERNAKSHWRFGLYWDESPQPQETVGPMLPDADRVGYTVGYGLGAEKFDFDIALAYVDFESRTTTSNIHDFFGTYRSSTLSLGTSFRW